MVPDFATKNQNFLPCLRPDWSLGKSDKSSDARYKCHGDFAGAGTIKLNHDHALPRS